MFGLGVSELIVVFICLIVPVFLVGMSPRITDNRKYVWIIITVFFSWFGYLFFMILTDKPART